MFGRLIKLTLHPLFRFVFWSFAVVWLIWMGVAESGWVRWIDFIVALVLLDSAIEYGLKSVRYYHDDAS